MFASPLCKRYHSTWQWSPTSWALDSWHCIMTQLTPNSCYDWSFMRRYIHIYIYKASESAHIYIYIIMYIYIYIHMHTQSWRNLCTHSLHVCCIVLLMIESILGFHSRQTLQVLISCHPIVLPWRVHALLNPWCRKRGLSSRHQVILGRLVWMRRAALHLETGRGLGQKIQIDWWRQLWLLTPRSSTSHHPRGHQDLLKRLLTRMVRGPPPRRKWLWRWKLSLSELRRWHALTETWFSQWFLFSDGLISTCIGAVDDREGKKIDQHMRACLQNLKKGCAHMHAYGTSCMHIPAWLHLVLNWPGRFPFVMAQAGLQMLNQLARCISIYIYTWCTWTPDSCLRVGCKIICRLVLWWRSQCKTDCLLVQCDRLCSFQAADNDEHCLEAGQL